MRPSIITALVIAWVLLLAAVPFAPLSAQDAVETGAADSPDLTANVDYSRPSVSEAALSVERIALATSLADEARAAGSPVGLAAAAEILSSEGTTVAQRPKTTEGGVDGPKDATPVGRSLYNPLALYAEAAELARSQSFHLLAEVIESMAASGRGRQSVGGGVEHHDRLRGNATDVYSIAFRAHERAIAMAVADGDVDIDLVVKDEHGNTVASDRDDTHIGKCEWTPLWTGDFLLHVTNVTDEAVNYSLLTN
ncbi:MAG: hypothetical protein LBR80_08020 [Deltaproteobacteria bacterium]|jgi:hypothetical protein|nr:hypothetical protein [Deltaproteobacteria bacterium]